eukprot:s3427_g4.t1
MLHSDYTMLHSDYIDSMMLSSGHGLQQAAVTKASTTASDLSGRAQGAGSCQTDLREPQDTETLTFPAEQRSRWLPTEAEKILRSHPSSAKHAASGVPIPPEALFSWNQPDFEIYVASAGYVKPKLKVSYYLSPECPQTIVDLVSPPLREMNWTCSVAQQAEIPPIFIWEGSRRSIDPAPTLSRGGLVNRVSGAFSITTKVGMLKAVHSLTLRKGTAFPPPWYSLAYELPADLEIWRQHAEQHPQKRWIYKPNGGARGIGLILVSSVSDVDSAERPFQDRCRAPRAEDMHSSPLEERYFAPSGIIQDYVQDLQLLRGHKFAVRTYVLIARVKPLLVLLHGAAYAKVCGQAFDSACFSQADLFRHVTNQEFQKKGSEVHEDWKVWPVMLLRDLAEQLHNDQGQATLWLSSFWTQVREICLQVIDSFSESIRESQLGMFEILGLDFVCKADGSLIFLEANRDPSWVIDGGAKKAIIPALVSDMLSIVLRCHGDGGEPSAGLNPGGHEFQFEILVDDAKEIQAGGKKGSSQIRNVLRMLGRLAIPGWVQVLRPSLRAMSAGQEVKRRRVESLSVGMVGFGSIGKVIAESLNSGAISGVSLSAVIVQNQRSERPPEIGTAVLTTSIEEFLAADWSLCVEVAGQPWVRDHGKTVLAQGRDLLVTSVGVFTDDQLLEDLTSTARGSNSRLLLPAGAMPGLDWMSSAALDEVEEITLEQRKRPEGWRGTPAEKHLDLTTLTEEATVFQGPAREAASEFPKNANIAAALALGTVGLDKLQVRLVADPTVPGPTNRVTLKGRCGELSLEVRGKPLSQRTSRIVPFSVLKALKNLSSPLSIGMHLSTREKRLRASISWAGLTHLDAIATPQHDWIPSSSLCALQCRFQPDMAARASTRRSAKISTQENPPWASKSGEDELLNNDELREKIERERGADKLTGLNKKVDEGDFQAVLKKEGVGTNGDSTQQRSFVEQPAFDIAIASAIILNCIVLGLEIDLAQHSSPALWIVFENLFCLTWIVEMLLKVCYLKLAYFKDLWNYLDLFLVFLAIYDAWISRWMASASDLGYLRVIRMLRLLRLVKLFKVMKMSRNLWLLVQGFIESFSTLCWVSFLILFVIYAYSCLFRILVDCGKDFSGWSDCSMLFGSMPKAMFTLFQMLTLESWSMLIARPLIEVNPALFVVVISFILMTTFGLLNIIVGVVVENTLSVAKQNMDLQTKRAERQLFKELELLRTVFEEADVDGSGTMDKREFCEICNTISVRRALHRMGVPLDQAETLFDIIDSNKMGEVSFPDFVEGVKNVRGVPTNLDMKTMIVAVKNIHKQQVRFEKESVQLQRVLLEFIQEAQEDGNVINLPPKEELDELLKVRKGLTSMPTGTFSNYSPRGVSKISLREEARNEAGENGG